MKDEFKRYQDMSIRELAEVAVEHRDMKDHFDNLRKDHQSHFDHITKSVLPEKMAEEDIANVKFDGIGRVHVQSDMYVSTKKGAKEDLIEWFESQGLGDLIAETVNASTLKAWVKECRAKVDKMRQEGVPEDQIPPALLIPSDFINVEPFERAVITKN